MKRRNKILPMALAFGVAVGSALAQPADGPGPQGQRPPTVPVIAALDANNDGIVDANELAQAAVALKKLDQNNDGQLTVEELQPRRGPFGRAEMGPPGRGPGRGARGRGAEGLELGAFATKTHPNSDVEKKILEVLDDMRRNPGGGGMSVPEEDGRILRLLAESHGAKHVVELGTSVGYSGVWFCLGLRQTGGRLTTYEIDPRAATRARQNFKRAGVDQLVTLVEGDAHEEVIKLKEPIDLLFLDADKEGYLDYLNKLLPLVRPGGLIVAHNMNRNQADPRYVKAITTSPNLETVFINLETSGIGVTLKKR